MPKPIFVGDIHTDNDGNEIPVMTSGSQRAFNEHSKKFKSRKVKMVISDLTETKVRSIEQNNYYRGVVVKSLAEYFGYIGPGEKEDLHNELRALFLVKIGRLGEPYVESTKNLSTVLFERYLEAIRTWAIMKYRFKIPKPNEVDDTEELDTYTQI